jgi:hypothetical protein
MQQEQTPVGAPIMTDELEERSEGQASPDNVTDDLTWDISRLDITSLRTDQIYTHPESIEPHMEEVLDRAQAVAPSPLGAVDALQRYDLPFDMKRNSSVHAL